MNGAYRFISFEMRGSIVLMAGLMGCLLPLPLPAEEPAVSFAAHAAQAQEGGAALVDDLKNQPVSQAAVVPQPIERLRVCLSWGHQSASIQPYRISLLSKVVQVNQISADGLEAGDVLQDGDCQTRAGAGDVDAVTAELSWPKSMKPPLKPQSIWQSLLDNGEPGQVARLKDDPGLTPDSPVLTVQTVADGTRGFSIGLEQLARHRAMWLPEHDVFVTLADAPVDFAAHLAALKGERVLDRVKHQPEATLVEWTGKWADFGNPTQPHHGQETELLGAKGHLTGFVAAWLDLQVRRGSLGPGAARPFLHAQVPI